MSSVPRKLQATALSFAAAFGIAAAAGASAPADHVDAQALPLIANAAERFDRSLRMGALTVRYEDQLDRARDLDAAPARNLLQQPVATAAALRDGIEALSKRIAEAKRETAEPEIPAPSDGAVAGVPMATLESIAACESGGDPTAVNAAGYYGKYQFDQGTWAAVGGSGNPAEAPEAEQDYRAALLYSQSGASPWPVCGS